MDAAEEKGRSVIGYCSDYKAGMDAGRKIAEAEYHNWELTLLFGKNAYKRDDYFWDTDLQEIYDQARNASIIKTHLAQDLRPVKQCLR